MRIGLNPYKDQILEKSEYLHQVVIPVYIPSQEDYFKDSFEILKICIKSLLETINKETFVTIVNNGSCPEVTKFLMKLHKDNKIQEIIHVNNIGKLNAILKGIVGTNIELVTISDSDVFFLEGWQSETYKIFNSIPKAGVVGIVPQIRMYKRYCGNVLFENLFNSNLKFLRVKNKEALVSFYDSLGWDRNYNQDYLKYNLGLKVNSELNVLIGSGHFVATYKKNIFEEVKSFVEYKMGGSSEQYLDMKPLEKGYWRLTTEDNFAYHMGNKIENWMYEVSNPESKKTSVLNKFTQRQKQNRLIYFLKNRLFAKILSLKFVNKLFLRLMKLPKSMIKTF